MIFFSSFYGIRNAGIKAPDGKPLLGRYYFPMSHKNTTDMFEYMYVAVCRYCFHWRIIKNSCVSTNMPKTGRVGRSENLFIFHVFFLF